MDCPFKACQIFVPNRQTAEKRQRFCVIWDNLARRRID
jgi:hypothetical protein